MAAYLGRYRGQTRLHSESDLRVFLRWCTDHELDPLVAVRVDIERYVRWLQTQPSEVSEAVRTFVHPALDLTGMLLPGMLERRAGTLLFVAGLGAVIPLPGMGALAVASAALRTYALTINAALAGTGVYAGALVIGGLIEHGDIHRHAVAAAGPDGAAGLPTLDPATIADTAWELAARQERSEAIFNALG